MPRVLVKTLNTPTDMTDAEATRLGLKQYLHGTTYSGGNAPTVTLFSGGGTLTSVTRAVFVPYQTSDNGWRMKLNINVVVSSASRTSTFFSFNGVTFKNVASFQQAVCGGNINTPQNQYSYVNPNASTLGCDHASGTTSGYFFSGDVELDSKPTWAY